MTPSPSRLNKQCDVLVIDASVAINFLGTGKPADLLRCLHREILIDERALHEVKSDPFHKKPALKTVDPLVRSGLISVVQLSPSAFESTFLDLVGAPPPDDLGDGEAATLAQSFETGAIPVIDERKATRVALAMRPQIHILNTIDILSCAEVVEAFAPGTLAELITDGLFHARMRVPAAYRPWVYDIIGMDRARQFPSFGPIR